MGQRHQIYVKLPAVNYGDSNPNSKPSAVIGIHHQWLYGHTAARQLHNLLTFFNNQQQYGPFTGKSTFSDPQTALVAIYSVDIATGYYHQVAPLSELECEDPRNGDNNDGTTIVDFTGKKPKYAFMSIETLECAHKSQIKNYKNFEPISARNWINLYYPDFDKPLITGAAKNLRDSLNITDEYSEQEAQREMLCALVNKFDNFNVLTKAEIKNIFPSMFPKRSK